MLFLDSLRGLAALVVMLFHGGLELAYESPIVANIFVRNGYLMVDLFFVLSGFVIAYSYADRLQNWQLAIAFQIRRALRLLPLHLVVLFTVLSFEFLLFMLDRLLQVPPFGFNDTGAFFSNLFLLQAFTETDLTFNKPSWSISVEFYTYAIFAGLMLVSVCFTRTVLDIISFAIVIGCGIYLAQFETLDITQTESFFRCLFSFFMGVLVCRFSRMVRFNPAVAPASLGATILLLACRDNGQVPDLFFPPLFGFCVLSLVASGPSPLKHALDHPALVRLGTLSYGIYLWHWSVFWALPLAVGAFIGIEPYVDPVLHDTFLPLDVMGQTMILAMGVVLTFALSSLTYRWVETPCNDWGRQITSGAGFRVPLGVLLNQADT